MSLEMINALKAEWVQAKYTFPTDDNAHTLPEDDPEYEPFELSYTYEIQQCRLIIKDASFPSAVRGCVHQARA